MSPKLRTLLLLAAIIIPLDQAAKLWVESNISPVDPIRVIPGFFWITHARNPGAALGLAPGVPVIVFIALTLVAIGLIWSFYRRVEPGDTLSGTSLGLILAGAVGNLIDRVFRGEVIDFLHFFAGDWKFPDFNVADSAIVIGVALLLLDVVAAETEESTRGEPEEEG